VSQTNDILFCVEKMLQLVVVLLLASQSFAATPTPAPTHSLEPTRPTVPPTSLPTANDNQYVFCSTLYHSTNGPNWKTKTNWMSGDPCASGATWFGLTCGTYDVSGRSKITQISLNGNR
jgi:hypothetical protein